MKVALFSDVHGHLRLLLRIVRNWQMAHMTHIDAILIAGDLGCFPDVSKFDKTTRRWLEADPEEAGFAEYFVKPNDEITRLFAPEFGEFSDVRCPILFVAGNHEDYEFLSKTATNPPAITLRNTFPVDCYNRIYCIRDGAVTTLSDDQGTTLRVAGIWGIQNTHPEAPYRINPSSVTRLERLGRSAFDILLTHDAPAEAYPSGSTLITRIIKRCSPDVHLFGHVHVPTGKHTFSVPSSETKCVAFKDVSFGKDGKDTLAGSIGVLHWTEEKCDIEVVNDRWLGQMRRSNWEQIWPEATPALSTAQ